jgi:hypothetical protein
LSALQLVSYLWCGETFVHLRASQRSTYSLRVISDHEV